MKSSRHLATLTFILLTLLIIPNVPRQTAVMAQTPAATTAATQSADTVVPYLGVLIKEDFPDPRLKTFTKFGNDNWQLIDDNSTQVACNQSTSDFSGLGFGEQDWKNYSVEIRAKIVSWDKQADKDSGKASLALRGHFYDNGWPANYTADVKIQDQQVDLGYLNSKHGWVDLGSKGLNIKKDTWYILRGEVQGNHLRYFFNGRSIIDRRDSTFAAGGAAIVESPQTNFCVGYIIVRSLDNSPEALAGASKGRLIRNAQVLSGLTKTDAVLSSVQKGDEVFILDANTEQKQTLIRSDKSGIQGWIPSDALGLMRMPSKTS